MFIPAAAITLSLMRIPDESVIFSNRLKKGFDFIKKFHQDNCVIALQGEADIHSFMPIWELNI
jgi:hypothetical protein